MEDFIKTTNEAIGDTDAVTFQMFMDHEIFQVDRFADEAANLPSVMKDLISGFSFCFVRCACVTGIFFGKSELFSIANERLTDPPFED